MQCRIRKTRTLAFERLEDRTLLAAFTEGNILVANGATVTEYTVAGAVVQSIAIQPPVSGVPVLARDAVVDHSGRLHVMTFPKTSLVPMATEQAYLSTYDSILDTWQHNTISGWTLGNVTYFGGIGINDDFVFAPDNNTGGGESRGIVRFPLNDLASPERFLDGFSDPLWHSVKVGLDGFLYALNRDGNLTRINPDTMAVIANFNIQGGSSFDSVAVDADGDIYIPGFHHFDNTGSFIESVSGPGGIDLEISPNGMLIAGSGGSTVTITNTALTAFSTIDTSDRDEGGLAEINFVALVPPLDEIVPVELTGTKLTVIGTNSEDTIAVKMGDNVVVTLNGAKFTYAAADVTVINVYGLGGTDKLTFTGASGNETVTARPGVLDVTGPGYALHAGGFETQYVYSGGGADDRASLYDSAGNDTFAARPTYGYLSGSGFYNYVGDFDRVSANATAGGTADQAYLYDSTGNDTFAAKPTYAYLSGIGFYNYAGSFDKVYAYATAGGTTDQAYLYDSAGNDTFVARPTAATMSGTGFYNYAGSFDSVSGYATAGGTADQASFYDSAGNDTFVAKPTNASMSGTGFYNYASSFDNVYAYATAGGTADQANLYDSAGNDTFVARPTYASLYGSGFNNYVSSFDKVYAYATAGGTGDQAYLYDSAGNDTFAARPTYAYLSGTGFYNYASNFDRVNAYATAGNAGGTGDQAYLYDSIGADTYYGRSNYGRLTGTGFYNYFAGFQRVSALATAGGTDTLDVRVVDYIFAKSGTWENVL